MMGRHRRAFETVKTAVTPPRPAAPPVRSDLLERMGYGDLRHAPDHVVALIATLAGAPPHAPEYGGPMPGEVWVAQVRRVADEVWREAHQAGRLYQAEIQARPIVIDVKPGGTPPPRP